MTCSSDGQAQRIHDGLKELLGYVGFLAEMEAKYASDRMSASKRCRRASRLVDAAFAKDVECQPEEDR